MLLPTFPVLAALVLHLIAGLVSAVPEIVNVDDPNLWWRIQSKVRSAKFWKMSNKAIGDTVQYLSNKGVEGQARPAGLDFTVYHRYQWSIDSKQKKEPEPVQIPDALESGYQYGIEISVEIKGGDGMYLKHRPQPSIRLYSWQDLLPTKPYPLAMEGIGDSDYSWRQHRFFDWKYEDPLRKTLTVGFNVYRYKELRSCVILIVITRRPYPANMIDFGGPDLIDLDDESLPVSFPTPVTPVALPPPPPPRGGGNGWSPHKQRV
ncbi:MAG: hypothetical protein M1833_003178 [Piccolia ochrophora]|nr:MAG: hypothetical protein M1833_003178 [Piccolia ochrophora]